ncbi:tRNA-dihydrouridine synthase family protein [Pseudoflavonifractor sp. 524-17]|uniref:tRNA dihydrouridine synthase n=1 Tax=Pseudoflavonifractor sp. 524-17 TaxID=2304577 RepID=UPI0013795E91|nr:tRNA-dihydrouridine synthase family protein [Pseudoflavonifractor sp. 524-17]NCE65985.1 tRNA-dihydrouridine synthase family protein [Pseudoflavonifractor sp. 524-17]
MQYYCAPLEGITSWHYRNLHHRYFPGVDRYYTPFLSPSQHHVFSKREQKEIHRARNQGVPVVPQLMTRQAEDFIWAANALFDLGYQEVNLNLGCPSGTVVAKGKGAGFLARREELYRFLEEVFQRVSGPVSIKTRLGLKDPEEFWPVLACYNQFPIAELTVHFRVQKDFYRNPVRREGLARVLAESRHPVCYNGDLVTDADFKALKGAHPAVERVMAGRGLMADPSLICRQKGGGPLKRETLRAFLDELYECYCVCFDSRRNAMLRMKELWFYQGCLFQDSEKLLKILRKATDWRVYEDTVERIFGELELLPEPRAGW